MSFDYPIENLEFEKCPVLFALEIVGQKWTLPILCYLYESSPIRYGELKRKLSGITNVMLTKSLRELESDGLIKRTQFEEIPPRVEYSLAPRGEELIPVLNDLYKWGLDQMSRK